MRVLAPAGEKLALACVATGWRWGVQKLRELPALPGAGRGVGGCPSLSQHLLRALQG